MIKGTLETVFKTYESEMMEFIKNSIRIRSYSDEEGEMAGSVMAQMKKLGFDEVFFDSVGNVVGRIGNGAEIIHFDSHMDTVLIKDANKWEVPPLSGGTVKGRVYGRGSVDAKSALCAAIYGAAIARDVGYTENKTIFVTASVCEEYCDGEAIKLFYKECGVKPDYAIICEPSDNKIALGHKGKAQAWIKTRGCSSHSSDPEGGSNAVYEMTDIIRRVEELNKRLFVEGGDHGTIAISSISCDSASLNAVPSECSIYVDRRLAFDESLSQVKKEMDGLVEGKNAFWEPGTIKRTSWKGVKLTYEPMHNPWTVSRESRLASALDRACESIIGSRTDKYIYWDFGTNAVTPVSMGIPTIGFGPGDYKLSHSMNENCPTVDIKAACKVYAGLIGEL